MTLTAAQALATLTFDLDGQLPTIEYHDDNTGALLAFEIDRTKTPAEVVEMIREASLDAQSYSDHGDYCRLCRRATDHGGEHSDKQYLEYLTR